MRLKKRTWGRAQTPNTEVRYALLPFRLRAVAPGGLRTYPRYRRAGRFFGRRVNCEHVPLLPAGAVVRMLDDPRRIPYLLVWRSRSDHTVQEAVRIAPHHKSPGLGGLDWSESVEIKRHDGTRNFIRTVLHQLPRNSGRVRLLVCPYCQVPRPGVIRLGAGRTVHYERHSINLGMPRNVE